MFEGLRARIEQFLSEHTVPMDPRSRAAALQSAIVDLKAALPAMRQSLATALRDLASERKQLEDAERRGKLAEQIRDQETIAVAERFTARHRERVSVLERKTAAQREELALLERDLEQLLSEFRTLKQSGPITASTEAAWREIEAAGGTRPEHDLEAELLRSQIDRARLDQAVDAQLAELKKKLGKKEGEE